MSIHPNTAVHFAAVVVVVIDTAIVTAPVV